MAGTEVTLFGDAPLPAHLVDLNDEGNIEVRERIPTLSFRGKVWRIVMGGNEEIVNRPGTDEPAAQVAGVFLDYNKARSRAYFPGAYEEGKNVSPTCWSHDGVTPHDNVADKQSTHCASCPQSQKGSKITEQNKEVAACSQFKRLAFVPIQNTKHPALLLKLPQTSMWDKDAEEWAAKNWYAWDQYLEMLLQRGVKHTANVVTKVRFDPRPPYPKLLFSAAMFTPPEVYDDIRLHLANREVIEKILNIDPAGHDPDAPAETASEAPAAAPAPAGKGKPAPKAAPAPEPEPEPPATDPDDDDVGAMIAAGTGKAVVATAAAKPAAAPARKGAKAATPAKAAPAAAPAAEVVKPGTAKSTGINDLLSSWSDES